MKEQSKDMEAKEKAKELVKRFKKCPEKPFELIHTTAKQCALICVDEMLKEFRRLGLVDSVCWVQWQEVKQEIENL